MPTRYSPVTIRPKDGGQLSTRPSGEVTSGNNYTIKENWRRDLDQEIRREGWLYFQPRTDTLGTQHLNVGSPVTMLHMVRRPNGKTAVIAAAGDKLYRFFALEDPYYFEDDYMLDDCVYIDCEQADWIVIGQGFDTTAAHRWEAVDLNGWVVLNNGVDLPVTYRVEDYEVKPIYQLRENGVASVGTITVYNSMLLCADITEIRDIDLTTVLSGPDPYGLVDDGYTIRIQYRVLLSNIGDPRAFGSNGTASISAGSTALVFQTLLPSWAVSGTDVTIAGAGTDGGNLTAAILSVSGMTALLDTPAVTTVSGALVLETEWIGGTAGRYDLQDDASQILRMAPLENRLVVYRNRSIFLGSYTGSAASPISFEKIYEGDKNLYYRYTLATVAGSYHIFAGANSILQFDLTNRFPQEVQALELCKNLFYDSASLVNENFIFATNNPITKEVWFCYPVSETGLSGTGTGSRVLAFDYAYNTASTIDVGFSAAEYVEKPLSVVASRATENWFIMGTYDGFVLQYGKTNEGFEYYSRIGEAYTSTLQAGLTSPGTDFNEGDMRSYVLKYSSQSEDWPVTVTLYKTNSPHKPVTQFASRGFVDPIDHNLFPVWARAIYFQDKLTVAGLDNPVRLSARVFEFSTVDSRSVVVHNASSS